MKEIELDAFMKIHRELENSLRVEVKIPHDEVNRIVVNRLIAIRNENVNRNSDMSHIDKTIRIFLTEDEFQKYVIDKQLIEYSPPKHMEKLISELRELIDFANSEDIKFSLYLELDEKLKEMEAKIAREPKPKKSAKFVVLIDNTTRYILKRKDISSISFRIEPYEKVTICMKNGRTDTFSVSENKEVLENLISDFKG